jgi:hypothetical protein
MTEFDKRGRTSERGSNRSLWTDAFAVCALLGLARATGDRDPVERALLLVDTVQGLERKGAAREGREFRHLTKWMHALDQVARATSRPRYNEWARELGSAALATVPAHDGARPVVARTLSIDVSRTLVESSRQLDAIGGFVALTQVQATAAELPGGARDLDLHDEIAALSRMIEGTEISADDLLGVGELLADAWRLQQLGVEHDLLVRRMLRGALEGLVQCRLADLVDRSAHHRSPLRELGLALGLRAVEPMLRRAAARR